MAKKASSGGVKASKLNAELVAEAAKRNVDDFEWTMNEEPHATRRKEILHAHPEIKELYGPHWFNKYFAVVTIAIQLFLAWYCSRPSTPSWQFWTLGYVVGGSMSHSLTLAIHEISHNLFFQSPDANLIFGYLCNLPLVAPYSVSFKKYHLEHHRYQGVDKVDTDIPTELEGRLIRYWFTKLLWVFFQPVFYAFRPLITNPKKPGNREILNTMVQIIFLAALVKSWGWGALGYLGFSTFIGLGFHPCAGHFISEHYTCLASYSGIPHVTTQSPIKAGDTDPSRFYPDETFSYRGPLNWISYYVGYHVAHHDFPFVAGFRLPEVEKIAPEYYAHLPSTQSWPGTLMQYIFSRSNAFDRVKRAKVEGGLNPKSK